MRSYRKKPVVVEAVQYTAYGKLVRGMCNSQSCYSSGNTEPHVHTIHDGQIALLAVGDWILPEPDGKHFYPCKPDIFAATYEPAGDAAPAVRTDEPTCACGHLAKEHGVECYAFAHAPPSPLCPCKRTEAEVLREARRAASPPRVTATPPEPTPEAYLVVQDNSGHREAVALHKVGAEQIIRTIHSEYGEHYGTFSIVPLSRTPAPHAETAERVGDIEIRENGAAYFRNSIAVSAGAGEGRTDTPRLADGTASDPVRSPAPAVRPEAEPTCACGHRADGHNAHGCAHWDGTICPCKTSEADVLRAASPPRVMATPQPTPIAVTQDCATREPKTS